MKRKLDRDENGLKNKAAARSWTSLGQEKGGLDIQQNASEGEWVQSSLLWHGNEYTKQQGKGEHEGEWERAASHLKGTGGFI